LPAFEKNWLARNRVKRARTDPWEPWAGNRPGPPDSWTKWTSGDDDWEILVQRSGAFPVSKRFDDLREKLFVPEKEERAPVKAVFTPIFRVVWPNSLVTENNHGSLPLIDFFRVNGQAMKFRIILFGIGQVDGIEPKTISPRWNGT
jgi:hypothetical protein